MLQVVGIRLNIRYKASAEDFKPVVSTPGIKSIILITHGQAYHLSESIANIFYELAKSQGKKLLIEKAQETD